MGELKWYEELGLKKLFTKFLTHVAFGSLERVRHANEEFYSSERLPACSSETEFIYALYKMFLTPSNLRSKAHTHTCNNPAFVLNS